MVWPEAVLGETGPDDLMSAEHQTPARPTAEGILPTASRSDRPLWS